MGRVTDHELEHDDPSEIHENVTITRDADVPEEIEERLRDEDDDDEEEDASEPAEFCCLRRRRQD
jgi:hypothetical protein